VQGVAQMLGRQGPTGGDPLVAELLRRTYDGTRDATKRFEQAKIDFVPGQTSVYGIPFPQMTLLQSYWIALVYWEMATAYTDGVITTYFNEAELPRNIYDYGDSFCDVASSLGRDVIKLASEYADRGKIPTSPVLIVDAMDITEMTVLGQWKANLAIVDRVLKDMRFISQKPVPKRMVGVHDALEREMKLHTDVIASLKRDFAMTSMLDNKCELTIELDKHAREALQIGQKLWAPYNIGSAFMEALKRQPTLAELSEEFDPWTLTDPQKRVEVEKLPQTEAALVKFWESIADRSAVMALAQQVNDALKRKVLRQRSNYPQVPWPSQFLVRSPISFGGRDFETGHLCSYFVTENDTGQTIVEMRKSGRLTKTLELMGQDKD
jgi:hypothetical protein